MSLKLAVDDVYSGVALFVCVNSETVIHGDQQFLQYLKTHLVPTNMSCSKSLITA